MSVDTKFIPDDEFCDVVEEVAATLPDKGFYEPPKPPTADEIIQKIRVESDKVLERCGSRLNATERLHLEKFGPPTITAQEVYESHLADRAKRDDAIYSGLDWWDNFAGPFRRSNVYALGGYYGAGKTTLSINLSWSIAKAGHRVWYYCLEMTAKEIFEVLAGHIRQKAVLDENDWTLAYAEAHGKPFYFHQPKGFIDWERQLDLIIKSVRHNEVDFLVIDNLGFLVRVGKNQYEAESKASAMIKALSQELDIPILLIAHLRKPKEDDREREPTVHTIKGSGAIMADASDAFILYHPLMESDTQSRQPVGFILSGKPRWGKGGKMYVNLDGSKRTYSYASSFDYQRPKTLYRKA